MNKPAELFAIREDLREKALSAKTPAERMHFALLKHACESDILNVANNSDNLNRRMSLQAQACELRSPHLLTPTGAPAMNNSYNIKTSFDRKVLWLREHGGK